MAKFLPVVERMQTGLHNWFHGDPELRVDAKSTVGAESESSVDFAHRGTTDIINARHSPEAVVSVA